MPASQYEVSAMLIANFFDLVRRWRRYEANILELSRLDDRNLADIGLNRSDIYRVAWESAQS